MLFPIWRISALINKHLLKLYLRPSKHLTMTAFFHAFPFIDGVLIYNTKDPTRGMGLESSTYMKQPNCKENIDYS